MSDLIDRRAAIDALDEIRHALWEIDIPSPTVPEYIEHHEQVQSVWKLLDKKQKELYAMPSAQPERKRGTWIIKDNPGTGWYRVTCSECGEDVTSTAPCIGFYPNAKVTWDYCPSCGADMREDDHEAR